MLTNKPINSLNILLANSYVKLLYLSKADKNENTTSSIILITKIANTAIQGKNFIKL